jgi:hypothetical protein
MTPHPDDSILEACLDEVLGGRTPPDLTARILEAWAASTAPVHPQAVTPPPLPTVPSEYETPEPPPVVATNGRPLVELRTLPVAPRPAQSAWQPLLVAASILMVGLSIGVVAVVLSSRSQLAEVDDSPAAPFVALNGPAAEHDEPKAAANEHEGQIAGQPVAGQAAADLAEGPRPEIRDPAEQRLGPNTDARQVVEAAVPRDQPIDRQAASGLPPRRYLDASPDEEIVSFVNAELARSWADAGVTAAPLATDMEWCRRLFVRVLGRIPTVEELDEFRRDRSRDKREKLVARLLNEDHYVAEYARHWAAVWGNVLIGRTGGQGNSPASRQGLEQYLAEAMAENRPYDALVHELLTASGAAQPGAPDYNGAVNFLLDGLGDEATVATSRVARVLLGTQLQCAQCHTHPTQDLGQDQFWALNAFFRQMRIERQGEIARLVDAGGQRTPGRGPGSVLPGGEVFYETPSGLLKTARPRFLDGTEIATGDAAAVGRRAALARLVVRSDQLPKALVNRLWAHFFGYGFTRPIDDVGPNASPSHPELLDRLAHEFEAHDYDLKRVIRWIALSDAFSRSSRMTELASKDMPEAGEVALFSRYYTRPMQAEEVYNSLVQAAQIRKKSATAAEVEQARRAWLGQFQRNMATDDAQEESHFKGLRQSLILMNGDLTRQAVSTQHAGLLKTLSTSNMSFAKKVNHLFLSALSREPTRREQRVAETILANSRGHEATALEDILWALLNSNEFILDH